MKGTTMLIGAGVLLTTVLAVQAKDIPPKDGKPLSEIVKSVDDKKIGVMTEVEFDDGLWEVELHKGTAETKLYIDPKSGKVNRQRDSADVHEVLPPKDAKPLAEIIRSLEDQKVGTITKVEFDDGFWEVTVRKDGKKVKMDIDPKSGKSHSR